MGYVVVLIGKTSLLRSRTRQYRHEAIPYVVSKLTPDIQPKLLQPSATEAIHAENRNHRPTECRTSNKTIITGILTERQRPANHTEHPNHNRTTSRFRNEPARLQHEKPHRQTEAAQKTSQPFGDFLEDEGYGAEDQAGEEGCHHVGSLDGVADWWGHHVDDQDGDREAGEVRGAEEYHDPLVSDAADAEEDAGEHENHSHDPRGGGDGGLDGEVILFVRGGGIAVIGLGRVRFGRGDYR